MIKNLVNHLSNSISNFEFQAKPYISHKKSSRLTNLLKFVA